MKYTQVKDDDGHSYVIPADKVEEWWDYIDEVYNFWRSTPGLDQREPKEPDWVERIDGGRLVFENWEVV
jgi:hypothetical protein